MADNSIAPSKIDWGCNTAKREADITLFRAIAYDLQLISESRGEDATIDVLSFPGPDWFWERGLCDAFRRHRFQFTGIERDEEVWKNLKRGASADPAKFRMCDKPCSFTEFAGAHSELSKPFDLVYLDWMGTWSREKKKDLDVLLDKQLLSVGGLLTLTLSLRRGQPETNDELRDLSYDLPLAFYDARGESKYVSNIKVRGIPHWVEQRALDEYDVTLRPLLASVYYSETGLSNQAQPQLQLLFLRTK